jgi:hypothetical protein
VDLGLTRIASALGALRDGDRRRRGGKEFQQEMERQQGESGEPPPDDEAPGAARALCRFAEEGRATRGRLATGDGTGLKVDLLA